MNLLLKTIIFGALIFALAPNCMVSQKVATPLTPEEYSPQREVGLLVGLGSNTQFGTMYVDCGDCLFDNGNKIGFSLGALYEQDIFADFRAGILLLYDNMSIDASFTEREATSVYSESTQQSFLVPVNFRHDAIAEVAYLSAVPYIKWDVFNFMFLRLGLSASYVASADIRHTKSLLDRYVSIGGIDSVQIELAGGGYEQIVEEGAIPEVGSFQFSAIPMAGFTFDIGRRLFFSPMFSFIIPLTNFSERGSDFKLGNFRFFLEFRYAITVDKSRYNNI